MNPAETQHNDEVNEEEGTLELNVFMEPEKYYIRSLLNNFPLFEIDGTYEDEIVNTFIQSIESRTLSEQILQLFEGCDYILQASGVICKVNDNRKDENRTYQVRLMKKDITKKELFLSDPMMRLKMSKVSTVC